LAPALLDVEGMIGEVVGNYEVLSCIGEGGMGAVYLARHRLIGRRAAIKVLLPGTSTNEEVVQRFFNEARSTSEVKHAGLIDVFDFGYHKGSAYIAMEFLEGESLASRLHREPRPRVELVAAVGRQVASALGAAHARGIVHRDLKPDNIFLVPDDEVAIGLRAKVLDFGIAKLSDNNTSSLKTRTNSLMGTPAYMSPEQCRGAKAVDARSDIYSLGCILFEMSTGRTPFVTEGLGEMMMAHMINEPPLPRALNPDLPEWLELVVRRAMAKRAEERYQSMEELATLLGARLSALREVTVPASLAAGTPPSATLRAAADSIIPHVQPTVHATPVPSIRQPRRGRKLYAALAGFVLAGTAAAVWLVTRRADPPVAPAMEPAEVPVLDQTAAEPAPPPEAPPPPPPAPVVVPDPAPVAPEVTVETPVTVPAHKPRASHKPKPVVKQRETGSATSPRPRRDGTLDPFAKEGGS
jgi:eukaryotic-like serine/threonine-protein kinase